MRPFELTLALRGQNAENRANVVRALSPAEVVEVDATLLAAVLVESSGVVRGVINERLAGRPAEARAALSLPEGHIDLEGQQRLANRWASQPGFVEGLLAYDRGRDLLGRVSLAEHALEGRLLELIHAAPGELLEGLLRLPLDLSGRLHRVLARLDEMAADAREALLRALVDASLADHGVVRDDERERAQATFALWVQGLIALRREGDLEPPSYADFVASGASFGQGVVTLSGDAPSARALAALEDLSRCLLLCLGPLARRTLLERKELEADLASALAERRVAAWKLLLRNELADPGEAFDAALDSSEAGVTVELLTDLPPGGLNRARVERLLPLLNAPRASLRDVAAEALAADPSAAALAAATFDPRDPHAPLSVLAAQPPALASSSLTAYLEVERPREQARAAFAALTYPPSPSWEHWARWLRHDSPAYHAAREALLRLPPSEAPELPALLEAAGDDQLHVSCAWRFELEGAHEPCARLLLESDADEELLRRAVEVLARYGDARSWGALWSFVVGGGPRRRHGRRGSRALALETLRDLPPPGEPNVEPPGWPSWASSTKPRRLPLDALPLLLAQRDPAQVGLALSWLDRHPGDAELTHRTEDLTWHLLSVVQRGPGARRWSLAWRRGARALLPRSWFAPAGASQRGRGGRARLLGQLLELLLRRGSRALVPSVVEPLLGHPDQELARAATRHLVGLLETPLERLVSHSRPEVVEEAVRVGHPAQVEALIARRLGAALQRPDATFRTSGETGADLRHGLAWLELRPSLAHLPLVERLLVRARGATREATLAALSAIRRLPGARGPVRELVRRELARTSEARAEGRLRATLDLIERFEAWELVSEALPALSWGGEATRRRLRELLRRASERGQGLEPRALEPLLCHPLAEVRTLAISLLRRSGAENPWPIVRPFGPAVRQRPTEFSKRFLGLCEDGFREEMTLSLEALLQHPNGEVARRALKLLNRQEQEIASATLLGCLDDPELRQPILTTFSTWSRRFFPAGLSAELLEEARRAMRARITQLCEGPRGQVLPLLDEVRAAEVPYERAAALLAVGRLLLEEERAWVAACLSDADPLIQRAAALAAASLAPDAQDAPADSHLDARLGELCSAREPEVRAAARSARVARIEAEGAGEELESLLSDRAPEVTLATLSALRARPTLLAEVALTSLLGDPDARVREAALRTLALAPRGEPRDLVGALRDPVPEVRLEALGVVAAWEVAESLAGPLGECLSDDSIHVSGAALELLGGELGLPAREGGGLKGFVGEDAQDEGADDPDEDPPAEESGEDLVDDEDDLDPEGGAA